MRSCILLGAGSDIGFALGENLIRDKWTVHPWVRHDRAEVMAQMPAWDLTVCAMGTLRPVAPFFAASWSDWYMGLVSNFIEPLLLIRKLHAKRNPGAAICFFGGTNKDKESPRYTAYAASKAALRMFTRDLAAENPDMRIFLLDPGIVATKLHVEPLTREPTTTHAQIYSALKWCLAQPHGEISGQFFYVPEVP